MDDRPDPSPSEGDGLWSAARRHPWITGTFVVCTLLGAGLGLALLTGEWSVPRRLLAGSVAGASTAFLLTATKIMGQ